MAQSVIGALRVNLGLDAAQFQSGTRRAQSSVQRLQRSMAIAGAAIAGALAGIGAMAMRGARDIDETAKAARRLDASTTGFQALQLAAGEAGVSLSGLTNDVQTLNRELSTQSTGAQRAVEALGLAFEDFTGLDADERIALIADRVQEMGLSAGEATGVLRDLGIRNREMALAVIQGGEAFRAARRDVEDYGLAISDSLAARMEEANDRIGRLSIVSQLFGRRLSEQLVPALGRLAETITDSVREGGRLRGVIDAMAIVSGILARAVDLVNDNLNFLIDLFKILVAAKLAIWIGSLLTGFIALARAIRVAGLASLAFTRITTAKITALALLGAVVARVTGTYDDLVGWVQGLGESLMNALPESLRDGIEGVGARIRSLGDDIDETDSRAANSFREMNAAANLAADSIGEVGARARTATPGIEGMGAALEGVSDAARQVESSFESAFVSFVTGAQSARQAVAGLLQDLARLAAQAAFRRLFGGFFGGLGGGFGGFRAAGGPVASGRSYVVGEKGPELFTPGASGHITPNHELGGASRVDLVLHVPEGVTVEEVGGISAGISVRTVKQGLRRNREAMKGQLEMIDLRGR